MQRIDQAMSERARKTTAYRLHRWIACGLALLSLFASTFYYAGLVPAATAAISTNQATVTDPLNSLRPQVAVDSANNLHVVWHASSTSGPGQGVKYAKGTFNGTGYTWSGPIDVFVPGTRSDYFYPRIAVDKQDQVNVVWTFNNTVYYKRWPAAGMPSQGTAPEALGNGVYPSIAASPDNRVHVVWESDIGSGSSNFEILYRESTGSGFTPATNLSNTSAGSLNPDIVIDSGGNVNVVWYEGATPKVAYARRVSGAWQPVTSISDPYSYFPSIAADGNGCVNMAWVTLGSVNSAVYRKFCNGQAVDSRTVGATTNPRAAVGATAAGDVVVAWDAKVGQTAIDNVYYVTIKNGTMSTAKQLAASGGKQMWPDALGLPNGQVAVVWQEEYSGQFDPSFAIVPFNTTPSPTPTPIPPAISGSLEINGGVEITRQADVNVVISNTSNTPATSYSLADGVQPPTPATPFSNPQTAVFTLDVADGQCRVHTVYGKIAGGGSVSSAFTDSIIYDPSAQADVLARNPNAALNLPLTGMLNPLIPTGDMAYTRQENFTLAIMAPGAECTGLKRYAVVQRGAATPAAGSAAWKDVGAAGYVSALTFFTANVGQGRYEFDVYVEDNAGNVSATPYVAAITYDTEGPIVSGTRTALPTSPSIKGGVATIDLGVRSVTDNLYQGAASDQNYWGYWVTVKQTGAEPTEDEWNKNGQIVPGQINGPLTWNMARGMIGAFQAGANYTVYIRLLDGAGNWSATLGSQPVTVNQLEFFGHIPLAQQ